VRWSCSRCRSPWLQRRIDFPIVGGRERSASRARKRFPGTPDVPTIAEQGLPQYEATLWQGFFAPSSISAELAARIARDVEVVPKQPETRENLAKVGVALFEDNQAKLQEILPPDIEKWKNLVKNTNLKRE
jgi:tripartite-type tricarboxylate transporter receptor subunit TctC